MQQGGIVSGPSTTSARPARIPRRPDRRATSPTDPLLPALTRAIAEDALELRYQPVIDMALGRVAGVEALLRWTDPVHGAVPPARFVPLAERSGLILPLGEVLVRKVAHELAHLPDSCRVAVNLSPAQATPAAIERLLAGLAPLGFGRLVLEVTETALLDPSPEVAQAFAYARTAGVRLALDDFGAGYASIGYLERHPIDILKIDKNFVPRPGGSSGRLAMAMLALARELGLETVAEGIETEEQLAFYHQHGCRFIQGYLLARPMTVAALDGFLADFVPPARPRPVTTAAGAPPAPAATGAVGDTLLAELLEIPSDWLWESDEQHVVTFISESARAAGFPPEPLLGRTRWDLVGVADPHAHPDWQGLMADLDARRPFRNFVYWAPRGDGRYWVALCGHPIVSKDGRFRGYRGTARNVTALHQAELERARQNEQLALASEMAGLGYWELDLAKNTVTWSDELWRIAGRDRSSFTLDPQSQLSTFHPGDRLWMATRLETARLHRQDFENRARIVRPDGTIRQVVSKARCRLGADGEVVGFFGILQDVTEQVEAEALLRAKCAENELFRQMVEAFPDDLSAKDRSGRFIFANRTRLDHFGLSGPDAILGRRDEDFFPADYAAVTAQEHRRVVGEGVSLRIERESVRPTGERRVIALTRSPLRDAQGAIVGALTLNRDITERVAAERALAAERDENALFRQIVAAIPDDLAVRDREGRYIFANATRARHFGEASPDRLIGRRHADFFPPEKARTLLGEDRLVLEGGAPRVFEREITQPSGETLVLVCTKSPVRDAGGRIIGVLTLNRDVTDRVAVERRAAEQARENALFRQMIEALPDLVYAKDMEGRFIAANKATAAANGYAADPSALLGLSDADLFTAERAAAYAEAERPCLLEGREILVEEPVYWADGNESWICALKTPLRDAAGRIVGLVGHCRDITELKRMRDSIAAQARATAVHQAMIEALPDFVFAKDLEGRFLAANAATARTMGAASGADLIGRTDDDFYAPDLARRYREDEIAFMAKGEAVILEQPVLLATGGHGWQCALKAPLRDAAGTIVGYVGHGRDITAEKEAALALTRMQGELEQAHGLLEDAVDSLGDGFALFDPEDRLILCNASFAHPYGASPAVLHGQTFAELQEIHHFNERLDLDGLTFAAWRERRLTRHLEADGAPYETWLGAEAYYVRERRTRDGRIMLTRTDITPLKKVESELRRLATIDPLTEIANRRHFTEQSTRLLERCRKGERPAALILADVDHFKMINDRFGHAAGDKVLQALSRACAAQLRPTDLLARWGGEEFILLLPDAGPQEARATAERLRRAMAGLGVTEGGAPVPVTLSLGVACLSADRPGLDALSRAADSALYAAKAGGRDRVEMADDRPEPDLSASPALRAA